MKLLENRSIIITGASTGIGRAAALLFARHGARLVLNARNGERLDAVCAEVAAMGGEAQSVMGDIADAATHKACVAAAMDAYGALDGAFNNAAMVGPMAPLAEVAPADFVEFVRTNLCSAHLAVHAQVPAMLKSGGGALVFTSSFVGNSCGLPAMGAYATSKVGLSGIVKSLAADYAHMGIRANALLPGGTNTAMAGDAVQKEWAAGLHPLRCIAQPEEIAQAALFLLSDMASFVTGSNLWADGGASVTKVQAPW